MRGAKKSHWGCTREGNPSKTRGGEGRGEEGRGGEERGGEERGGESFYTNQRRA